MCVLYFDHELSKGDSVLSKVVSKLNFKTHREMCQKVLTHTLTCRDKVCVDLSPYHVNEQRINGIFQGQPYVTWDIKVATPPHAVM